MLDESRSHRIPTTADPSLFTKNPSLQLQHPRTCGPSPRQWVRDIFVVAAGILKWGICQESASGRNRGLCDICRARVTAADKHAKARRRRRKELLEDLADESGFRAANSLPLVSLLGHLCLVARKLLPERSVSCLRRPDSLHRQPEARKKGGIAHRSGCSLPAITAPSACRIALPFFRG